MDPHQRRDQLNKPEYTNPMLQSAMIVYNPKPQPYQDFIIKLPPSQVRTIGSPAHHVMPPKGSGELGFKDPFPERLRYGGAMLYSSAFLPHENVSWEHTKDPFGNQVW